jgi:hypothetical protein
VLYFVRKPRRCSRSAEQGYWRCSWSRFHCGPRPSATLSPFRQNATATHSVALPRKGDSSRSPAGGVPPRLARRRERADLGHHVVALKTPSSTPPLGPVARQSAARHPHRTRAWAWFLDCAGAAGERLAAHRQRSVGHVSLASAWPHRFLWAKVSAACGGVSGRCAAPPRDNCSAAA